MRVAGGREIEVDAIVLGTGFAASEFLAPMDIRGRGGRRLNEAWADGAQAWLGITVPGFPNFFMLYGPNTNLGHNSIVFMLESQVAHVMRCLRKLRDARGTTIEMTTAPFERYDARIQQRSQRTVFAGCTSWYLDAHGRHTVNWPGFTTTYRWLTRYGGPRRATAWPDHARSRASLRTRAVDAQTCSWSNADAIAAARIITPPKAHRPGTGDHAGEAVELHERDQHAQHEHLHHHPRLDGLHRAQHDVEAGRLLAGAQRQQHVDDGAHLDQRVQQRREQHQQAHEPGALVVQRPRGLPQRGRCAAGPGCR